MVAQMATGTVKRVEATNGSGIIAADDGNEYFFHRGGIKEPLKFDDLFGGERVSFEVETNREGPRAIQVSRV
jgi:cold shock CspA family protein